MSTPNFTRVWATLPLEIYEYFFRYVLASEHRAKQKLTAQFYRALYDECQRRQIPAAWATGNSALIDEIMSHLNFNDQPH